MVSDHLSFSGNAHDRVADLLPIPYNQTMLDHFADQVNRVQHRLGRQLLIENPSCYLAFRDNEMGEPEFLFELIERTGCGLLLDINNIVVTTGNLGGASEDFSLPSIPIGWVKSIWQAMPPNSMTAGHCTLTTMAAR